MKTQSGIDIKTSKYDGRLFAFDISNDTEIVWCEKQEPQEIVQGDGLIPWISKQDYVDKNNIKVNQQ